METISQMGAYLTRGGETEYLCTTKPNQQNQKEMKNYSKVSVPAEARVELHDQLSLTGAEVSINSLPAGAGVPFVHSHKQNEEIYGILSGKGSMTLDGETVELGAGDWLRVAPEVKRQISASADEGIAYVCIQAKAGSLEGFTMTDAVL